MTNRYSAAERCTATPLADPSLLYRCGTENIDVIVVGAGHNGLICAAYLARSGLQTVLLESRDSVGGCASTVTDLGARFNICNCDHTMIRAMPIADELELESFGLRYLESEITSIYQFHDGSEPWLMFHDQERQLEALAKAYPKQVAGYRRYLDDALPVAQLALEVARTTPSATAMIRTVMANKGAGASRLLEWSRRSMDDVMSRYFDEWQLIMPGVSGGPTVWGVPPDMPGTGLAAAGYATKHLVRSGRPAGGSGALTDAVRLSFEASGGEVRCGARVARLLVDDGAIAGVELTGGERIRASTVVAACDPHRVMVDWIDDPPPAARRLMKRWHNRPTQDGYESKVDAVITGLPVFRASGQLAGMAPGSDYLSPTTFITPSPAQLREAHTKRPLGRVAAHPTMLVNIPSILDPAMQTDAGEHVLSLEVLYTPYALEGGWPDSGEPARWIGLLNGLVEPGTLHVDRWRAMTPDRYEREFSMHRGHTPSFAAPPLSSLMGRNRETSRYRTPISGLYLSGAGTFPGAGIFGAAGRNAADAVRHDLDNRRVAVRRSLHRLAAKRTT
jgi:phytoene dehydrogenase-like protein